MIVRVFHFVAEVYHNISNGLKIWTLTHSSCLRIRPYNSYVVFEHRSRWPLYPDQSSVIILIWSQLEVVIICDSRSKQIGWSAPVSIESLFKRVKTRGFYNIIWKTVPRINYTQPQLSLPYFGVFCCPLVLLSFNDSCISTSWTYLPFNDSSS